MGALEVVRELAEAVTSRRSLRLWDVELAGATGGSVVRVFVDSPGGVDLDTVAEVSEEISRGLDLHDPLPGRYTLEVSSPGLERSLKRPEHFGLCRGRTVMIKTKEPLRGTSHRLDGVIVAAGERSVELEVDDGDLVEIPYEAIKTARTVFDWN